MKKNQLIKSSFKESPISEDCPRNSHFLKLLEFFSQIITIDLNIKNNYIYN